MVTPLPEVQQLLVTPVNQRPLAPFHKVILFYVDLDFLDHPTEMNKILGVTLWGLGYKLSDMFGYVLRLLLLRDTRGDTLGLGIEIVRVGYVFRLLLLSDGRGLQAPGMRGADGGADGRHTLEDLHRP